ncbi:Cyclin N-terminal domain-containing protein 2 [Varanus komodoensis]|nr:Cyclin N-terminal domain-containing protein 2 [Varanus komodoensis]
MGKPAAYHARRPWPVLRKGKEAESMECICRQTLPPDHTQRFLFQKRVLESCGEAEEAVPEKLGPACPGTPAEPPPQRGASGSECLAEELPRALARLGMAPESEYARDIFGSLMRKQPSLAPGGFSLPRSVTAEMRALVVDWLVQVHDYLDLADDTLYLAVHLMNAYMRAGRVQVSALQLLGLTCLFLSCKVEESSCPELAQLCFMAEDSFSQKDLLRMERKILTRLKFELHYANPVHSLHLLAEVDHCSTQVQYLALYFLELSLLEVDCMRFEPARLSLAALCLARRLLLHEAGLPGVDASQEGPPKLLAYSEAELSLVYPYLAKAALRGPSSPFRATFLKFSRPQKLCTSTSPAIAASTFLSRCLESAPCTEAGGLWSAPFGPPPPAARSEDPLPTG